jgi:peptide/nickel transport system substrate-binding protein
LAALLAALTLVFTACRAGPEAPDEGEAGGVFRSEIDEMPWITSGGGFDPVTEYFQVTFSFYSNMLTRPLMNYNHLSPEEDGNVPSPDLAAAPPEVSDDFTTWTYTLREDAMWQPPLDRAITSDDVLYAFERLGTKAISADAGSYSFYYTGLIEGMAEFEAGEADTISGIETPDDTTIVFHLTEPAGDFDFRVAMPAAAPVPREVASCFDQPVEYGQFFMSSGPYMVEGSDQLDISSCDAVTAASPASGFEFENHIFLVRNPNYNRDRDNLEIRSALFDRYELRLNTNPEDSYAKLERGELEHVISDIPPATLEKYQTTPDLEPLLHIEPDDATWYLTMHPGMPPFDDIHVRKAANFIMDKTGLIQVIGGPVTGIPAEHIIPPNILDGRLAPGEFNPYGPDPSGNVEAALEEMKQSKYETDADGVCTDPACKRILHVTRNTDPFPQMAPIIEASMEKIGITLRTSEVESFYGEAGVPSKNVPFTSGGGWGKDWADPITFIDPLFTGDGVGDAGNVNLSYVGVTDEQAADLGLETPPGGFPNVDADVAACSALTGEERYDCWAALDQKLMTEFAPWIPWRWSTATHITGPAVTNWTWDAFASWPSYARLGVDTTRQL